MTFKSIVAVQFALLVALALAGEGALAQPRGTATAATSTLSAGHVRQIQETLREALPLYRTAAKAAHKEYGHGKLSVVHLLLIIGKVLAPLVGAIVEPLLINIAKGITWAITYSLATGFDKPYSYEHFVPALEHYGGGHGHGHGGDDDDEGSYSAEYESHKPVTYSLKELPGLALQLTSSVLTESSGLQPEHAEAMEGVERKLVGLLLQGEQPAQ